MIARRHRRLIVAVLAIAGAAAPLTGSVSARADDPLQVTRAERVNRGETVPTRTYAAPAIAVDPDNPDHILSATAELRTARCVVDRSVDGGRTWKRLKASPSLSSYPFCIQQPSHSNFTQTPIAFGRNHTAYLALAGWDVQDGRSASVLLARSSNLGDSWATTLVFDERIRPEAERQNNRPVTSVAVDVSGEQDVVHVGWTSAPTGPLNPPPAPIPLVATSTDGGRTFSAPVNASGSYFQSRENRLAVLADLPTVPDHDSRPQGFGGFGISMAVDRQGVLYALWQSRVFFSPAPPWGFYLSRSADGGKTFTVTEAVAPDRSAGNVVLRWSPVGGPGGTLHVVYEAKVPRVQGDRDIHYRRSTDGGATWSEPRVLNDDDPKLLNGQFLPNLSVAPNGRLDVVWWDFRDDPGTFVNDVYLAFSVDNGATWSSNVRVTDRSIDRRIGPWSNGYDVRQPPGVAGVARYTVVAWDDTRLSDVDGQGQDLFSAFVQYQLLPGKRADSVKYIIAALGGLLIAGLVITGFAVGGRRRAVEPAASQDVHEPAPAGTG